MAKLKLGCVGLRRGAHILKYWLSLKRTDAEIVAICDLNQDLLDSAEKDIKNLADIYGIKVDFKKFLSYEEMLKTDVDAIIIATPANIHIKYVEMAMNAGKHVLSEIPAVSSLEEAIELKKIVSSHPNLKYMSAENCCFLEFVQTFKKLYEDGTLGDIFYAEADYLHDCRNLMQDGNGNLTWRAHYDAINYITHDVGTLLYILNDEVESVSAFTPDVKVTPKEYTGSSNQIGIFKTKKGTIIKMVAGFAINLEATHNFAMYGTKGSIERNRNENWVDADNYLTIEGDVKTGKHTKTVLANDKESRFGCHGGADRKMVGAFVDCIINDTKSPIDVDLAINMALPGIYAAMSAKQGGIPLKIPKYTD